MVSKPRKKISLPIQLSYSASDKYTKSPRSYYFHYIRRIREANTGSALLFGNAIDGALNYLLYQTSEEPAERVFCNLWDEQEIHSKKTKLATCNTIKYSKADFDPDILTNDDKSLIDAGCHPSWVSLRRKGLMIIDAYRVQVKPRIKRVIATQKHVSLTNDMGDKFIGFVDLICEWEDGNIIIFDHKTSSVTYKKDSVVISKQLATYFEACKNELKVDKAGYIVLPKKFRKQKEPLVPIDVIIGDISESLIEETFTEYDQNLTGIKMGEFPCHSPNCDQPWGPCIYKKLCETGCMDGLIELEEKKK